MHFLRTLYWLLPFVLNGHASTHPKYSTWMLKSIISRGQGISAADGLLAEIQKGIFQEALRAAVKSTKNDSQAHSWSDYYSKSVQTGIDSFLDAATDAKAPLDRLCAGRSLLQLSAENQTDHAALKALRNSVDLQLRNANGGLWYYADPQPPEETYGNLSYSDGMYGFAPFATLYSRIYNDSHLNPTSVLHQLELIYTHCLHHESGLIVHGYDASRRAPWADPMTGASPIVWGRGLAWYTVGLVDALEIIGVSSKSDTVNARSIKRMRTIFKRLALAEIEAIRKSGRKTGRYGVWQVVDMPGKPDNFVEASASAMLTYALAKGIRLGYLEGDDRGGADLGPAGTKGAESALDIVRATYSDLLTHFVVPNGNGALSYTGTSIVASLGVSKLDYYYYTQRNVTTNSLIGSSAFVLASLEVERQR